MGLWLGMWTSQPSFCFATGKRKSLKINSHKHWVTHIQYSFSHKKSVLRWRFKKISYSPRVQIFINTKGANIMHWNSYWKFRWDFSDNCATVWRNHPLQTAATILFFTGKCSCGRVSSMAAVLEEGWCWEEPIVRPKQKLGSITIPPFLERLGLLREIIQAQKDMTLSPQTMRQYLRQVKMQWCYNISNQTW